MDAVLCFFRLNTKSLEQASMEYEAPLMPCGCILPYYPLHGLGSGPGLGRRERAPGFPRRGWEGSLVSGTLVLLGLGQHHDSSWEGPRSWT